MTDRMSGLKELIYQGLRQKISPSVGMMSVPYVLLFAKSFKLAKSLGSRMYSF
jgi:hypothetical protein